MGGGDQLTVTGTCGGDVTIDYTGGTPNGVAAIVFSSMSGSDALAGGPCAGTATELTSPQLLNTFTLDANGDFSLMRSLPAQFCGLFLQMVDGATCGVSNLGQLPQ